MPPIVSRRAFRHVVPALAASAAALAFVLPSSASSLSQRAKSPELKVPGTRPAGAGPQHLAATSLTPYYSATGLVTLSIDGMGTANPTGLIQVEKPSVNATVRAAYLIAASTGFCGCPINNGDVLLAGTPINWDATVPNAISSNNYIADVTAVVAPVVNPAPVGLIDLTVTENFSVNVDGEILAVVFDDPDLTQNFTAVIFFGAQNIAGDDFAITLGDPADPTNPNYKLDLSLGITFGYQGPTGGTGQVSLIDVNGQRMTSSAGGEDDGEAANGALITVGGIGDSNTNPPDPNADPTSFRYDDELYDLRPFVNTGDTLINVHTVNPSSDDNITFAGLLVSGTAVVGEGVLLAPVAATDPVGTSHTVTATLVTSTGNPISGRQVDFAVLSGPNTGVTGSSTSDLNGFATFNYSSTAVGTDTIQASFLNSSSVRLFSNIVSEDWTLFTAFCFGDGQGTPCPCANNGQAGNGCANSSHPGGANFSASGVASIANDTLLLTVTDQHSSSLTLFWQGDAQIDPIADGDGLRCVSGLRRLYRAAKRHTDTISAPPGTGAGETASVSQRSTAVGDPLAPGTTRYYYASYRDPVDFGCPFPATMNDTNAIQIIWTP